MNWRIPLSDIDFDEAESLAVQSVLKSRWLTMGKVTQEFEVTFAAHVQVKHAIAVTNATAALHLAWHGIKPFHEMQFFAWVVAFSIGAWVLKQACLLLKKWQSDKLSSTLMISVNVSAVQFNHAEFILQVENAIQQSGCDASKLCIELTESAVMSNIEEAIAKMHQIKAMGVSIAIDDFGTGYSSLSALKNLPLNELKIDRSFVKDFTKNPIDLTIVQTILQMGKNLNLRIVAEGVETEGQMAYLSNYGCNVFQGYFFAKPCSVDQFERAPTVADASKLAQVTPPLTKLNINKTKESRKKPVKFMKRRDFLQQEHLENTFNLGAVDYMSH